MRVDQNLRPNHIVLLTVLNAQYPIDVQIISKVTQPIGKVLRIVVFKRGNIVQSMVEFDDIQIATAAKNQLHGCDIYSGSCTLKVEFAKTDRLNVKRNDDMTWDYTEEFAMRQGGFGGSGQQRGDDRRDRPVLLQEPPPGQGMGGQGGSGMMPQGGGMMGGMGPMNSIGQMQKMRDQLDNMMASMMGGGGGYGGGMMGGRGGYGF